MIGLAKITGFDWDAGNARKNDKHDVTAAEAEQVFFNIPLLLVADAKHSKLPRRLRRGNLLILPYRTQHLTQQIPASIRRHGYAKSSRASVLERTRQSVPAYRRRARGGCPAPHAESRPFGIDP